MNRFAIDEDDQFEIHVKEYSDEYSRDYNETFLLCLLDKEERQKLERKEKDFMKTFWEGNFGREVDVPEAEWKLSEYNMKFARSSCLRRTYFIEAQNYNDY